MTVAQPVYVLIDSSGSTVRGGFGGACAQVLPMLVNAAAKRAGVFISLLTYATQARTLIGLNDPSRIPMIPLLVPAGLSSLADGLRLLAESVSQDTRQLAADGIDCLAPDVLVLADGLPTDPDTSLLAAREALRAAAPGMTALLFAVPAWTMRPGEDSLLGGGGLFGEGIALTIRGLEMNCRPIEGDAPDALASGILAIFECMLDGTR